MAETIAKRFGRSMHAIDLIVSGAVSPLQPGQTRFPIGSEEEAGYINQRYTTYKNTIRTILRSDSTSSTILVGDKPFTVSCRYGNIHVEPGVMKVIGLALFPRITTVTIYNRNGSIYRHYEMVGNPQII